MLCTPTAFAGRRHGKIPIPIGRAIGPACRQRQVFLIPIAIGIVTFSFQRKSDKQKSMQTSMKHKHIYEIEF
ncbi:MAG TPA: hypothetical protein VLS85_09315 [Hanamia sp.]|nr:hypothetical protein [Hanamia sp.]